MNRTVLVLMMAVTVEALVEYAKTFGKAILEKQWKTAATQAGAVALGVSLCFSAGADFYAALGVSFNAAWLGVALTGVFASRGANYVSDLVKKLQALGAATTESYMTKAPGSGFLLAGGFFLIKKEHRTRRG